MIRFKIIDKANPRKNLPNSSSKRRKETNFTLAFGRSYVGSTDNNVVVAVRELPLNGYGIADFVCLINHPIPNIKKIDTDNKFKIVIFAFEIKIKDWRSALAQAFRYRYYANQSIVVLPPEDALKAKEYIKTFKALYVGLWSYDVNNSLIEKIYTPSIKKPLSSKANNRALSILLPKRAKSLPSA